MSFRKFTTDLNNDNIKGVCLYYGFEKYLIDWAVDSLCKKYGGELTRQFDVVTLNGKETSVEKIIECAETLPMMSEKKIVIVDDFSLLEGVKGKNFDERDEKMLANYLPNVSSSCLLVFVCGEKVDKRKKLYKTIYEHGLVYEFAQLEVRDLTKWVEKQFKLGKKVIEDKTISFLISETGYYDKDSDYSLFHFENDISKIMLHASGDKIEKKDVEEAVIGNVSRNVFLLIECISEGKKKKAFEMLSDMFLYGETPYGIIALLNRQYENVYTVKQMRELGRTKEAIKTATGAQDFVIGKWSKVAEKYNSKTLRRILLDIYETDKKIKSGNMDGKIALEMLIALI